jgi:hypothetical protein
LTGIRRAGAGRVHLALGRTEGIALSSPAVTAQSTGISGRTLAVLVALAAVLLPAVFFAPHMLAANASEAGFADQRNLVNAVSNAFDGYWNSGGGEFTPDMERVVDYWFRFHLAKALIAATLLIVLIALGVLLWKAFVRAGGVGAARSVPLASAGVLVTMLGLISLLIFIANVQGTVAPFTSLLTMLPVSEHQGKLAGTLHQVRQQLAHYPSTGSRTSPALEVMISDNALYHVAVAVMAAILVVVFIGVTVVLWKRFPRKGSSDRRTRRVLGSFGTLTAISTLAMIVLAVANVSVAADPARGLLGFFSGGY